MSHGPDKEPGFKHVPPPGADEPAGVPAALPTIVVEGGLLPEVVNQAEEALLSDGGDPIYQLGTMLDPVHKARRVVDEMLPEVEENRATAFDAAFLTAAAVLYDRDEGAYASLVERLKQKGVRLQDWKRAVRRTRDESRSAAKADAARSSSGGRSQPTIQVNDRQLRDTVREVWDAVIAASAPEPGLFVREGSIVRMIKRAGRRFIELVTYRTIYGHCARIANWVTRGLEGETQVHPDKDAARDMIEYPHRELPPLEELITAPIFAEDGELIVRPGYHREHRLYFAEEGAVLVDDVPESPSDEQVQDAVSLLIWDLLGDFPFAGDADCAHAVGALVEPFARRLYTGRSPIHVAEAPTPGSGKSLFVETASIVISDVPVHARTLPRSEEEVRKAITAALIASPTLVLFDNADQRRTVDSATLSAALTAEHWSDRVLGYSRIVYLPNRVLYFLTGNNPRYSMELARRCVRIRLDPGLDRPWLRKNFRHPNLRQWARLNRARLVRAVLVLIQHWIACGRPMFGTRLGSFESWSEVIGGIVECAGIRAFLDNREELYELADAEGDAWREFVAHWWGHVGGNLVRPSDLLGLCARKDLLSETLGDGNDASKATRLGLALKNQRDRVYDGFRIELARDKGRKGRTYRLVRLELGVDLGDVEGQRPAQRPPSQLADSTTDYGGAGTLGDVERTSSTLRGPMSAEGNGESGLAHGFGDQVAGAPNVPQRPPEDVDPTHETAYGGGRWQPGSPERPHDVPPEQGDAGPADGEHDG